MRQLEHPSNKKTLKNKLSSFLTLPSNPSRKSIITHPASPNLRQLLSIPFNTVMKAGFVLITQGYMTLEYAAQFCGNGNKKQIQRKSMQPCFIHASFAAFAMPPLSYAIGLCISRL